jgi:hypothetical protein
VLAPLAYAPHAGPIGEAALRMLDQLPDPAAAPPIGGD